MLFCFLLEGISWIPRIPWIQWREGNKGRFRLNSSYISSQVLITTVSYMEFEEEETSSQILAVCSVL